MFLPPSYGWMDHSVRTSINLLERDMRATFKEDSERNFQLYIEAETPLDAAALRYWLEQLEGDELLENIVFDWGYYNKPRAETNEKETD